MTDDIRLGREDAIAVEDPAAVCGFMNRYEDNDLKFGNIINWFILFLDARSYNSKFFSVQVSFYCYSVSRLM